MKVSIQTKIIAGFMVTTLFVGILVGIISVKKSEADLLSVSKKMVRQTAKSAAEMVDVDKLISLNEGEEDTENYQANIEILRSFLQEEEITYIYTLKKEGDNIYFLVDADPEDPGAIGEEYESFEEIFKAFEGEATVTKEPITDEWGSYYSCFAPIRDDGGNIVAAVGVDYSVNNVKKEVKSLWTTLIVTELIGLVAAIILAIFISLIITGNIKKIGKKIKNLHENGGNLAQRIEIKSSDETREIANDINKFLENINQIVLSIHEDSERLAKSTESIEEGMKANRKDIGNINVLLNEMTDTMADTTDSLSSITEAAESIMAMADGLSGSALEKAKASEEIKDSAFTAYERSKKGQEEIRRKSRDIAKDLEAKIKEAEQIKQIEQLTNAIIDISGQTELLSLNASIEAARAGEHGRGFAVVAQEIGMLAGQSSDTAESITKISATIQDVVSHLAKSSETYVELVNDTIMPEYIALSNMGKEYQENMADIMQYMTGFAESMKKLTDNIMHIKDNIESISAAYQQETASITEISGHIGTISEAAGNVTDEAALNHELSDRLKQSVEKFVQ